MQEPNWSGPVELSREELDDLVIKELKKRNMLPGGPVEYQVVGTPPFIQSVRVLVKVQPVPLTSEAG
jgi:hypothetical protein